jgi:hypothetical protein
MINETRVAPDNSLILVMDRTVGTVPDSMNRNLVSATPSCVAIGTMAQADGETFISLSDEIPARLPKQEPVFDGIIPTPSKRLSVCSVHDEPLLVLDVAASSTRVRIWANHPWEPNEIWIVVGNNQRKGDEHVLL